MSARAAAGGGDVRRLMAVDGPLVGRYFEVQPATTGARRYSRGRGRPMRCRWCSLSTSRATRTSDRLSRAARGRSTSARR